MHILPPERTANLKDRRKPESQKTSWNRVAYLWIVKQEENFFSSHCIWGLLVVIGLPYISLIYFVVREEILCIVQMIPGVLYPNQC